MNVPSNQLTKTDFIIGSIIAVIMGIVFIAMSSGMSLIATFVPGVIFAWVIFAWIYWRKITLPDSLPFMFWYFVALSVQFLHFAEEYNSDFPTEYPVLYGGDPYSLEMFVNFNMIAYALFASSCVLVFVKHIRWLLLPTLFYVAYGAFGNAIAHAWWVIYPQAYFPGLYTAELYWLVAPMSLYLLLGKDWKTTVLMVVGYAVVLIPILTILMAPAS